MNSRLQTVGSILSAVSPAIEVPELLKVHKGRVMRPIYEDELLPYGLGFEFENELPRELFEQFKDGIENVRSVLFQLCNRYGLLTGSLSSPLHVGTIFNRAQGEAIWHVDRSDQEDEYYTLLSPADSTVAKTWISPIIHFLSVANSELGDASHSTTLEAIRRCKKATGDITNRITEVADSINSILNTGSVEQKQNLAAKIESNNVLVGGKHNWLLFSDPLLIHNGNLPTGEDKHIMTFDLARKRGQDTFYSVYANTKESS